MIPLRLFIVNILLVSGEIDLIHNGYCDLRQHDCSTPNDLIYTKQLFYDVNRYEGFNLRRDVYMRFATVFAEANKTGAHTEWRLVLPPWYLIPHWKHLNRHSAARPWGNYFDIDALKSYAPVLEIYETFPKTRSVLNKILGIDTIFILQHYEELDHDVLNKWEIGGTCSYEGNFWGYYNITAKERKCVKFQGKISQIWEILDAHPKSKRVLIYNAEVPLHDNYGSKSYWDCRKSMKFNKKLIKAAEKYMLYTLKCNTKKCSNYLSIHWRRGDFAKYRSNDMPSIQEMPKQIHQIIKKNTLNIKDIFIATDASMDEQENLKMEFKKHNLKVHYYTPTKEELNQYEDGGVAIIDQIVCSHAAFFIGTHESTFTYRIQEEREIMGFDSSTTFNRLCPDKGKCQRPSKWTIVN